MIEDKELRNLFRIESEEHIQKLENGLLHLEKHIHDTTILHEVFREAHNLKGAARLVGAEEVETVAHIFESVLGAAKQGQSTLSSETLNRLYHGLDDLRQLVFRTVSSQKVFIDVAKVVSKLEGKDNHPPANQAELKAEQKTQQKIDITSSNKLKEQIPPSQINDINTIRVEPQKLDSLMVQVGELVVTKKQIERWSDKIDKLITLWEEWNKDSYEKRFYYRELQRKHPHIAHQLQQWNKKEQDYLDNMGNNLQTILNTAHENSAKLDFVTHEIEEGICDIRLLPLSTIFGLFPRMIRDLANEQDKNVNLVINGGETKADKLILESMKAPLNHLIRNAFCHGIEDENQRQKKGKAPQGTIELTASQTTANITIEIKDDGRGIDIDNIKKVALIENIYNTEELEKMSDSQIQSLIFEPEFSTATTLTELSGRGLGLNIVQKNVQRLKGTINVHSRLGEGTSFIIRLPVTLATARVLIVSIKEQVYALPIEHIHSSCIVNSSDIYFLESRATINFGGKPLSVISLEEILNKETTRLNKYQCIVIRQNNELLGIFVDELIDEQEVVVKQNSNILKRVPNISGFTILSSGQICTVLNPKDLIKSVQKCSSSTETYLQKSAKKKVLLVEDSITTRTQEKRIIEAANYEVVIAVDGADALKKLKTTTVDAIVSDVEMPHINGFELTAQLRKQKKYKNLPIILVTSLATIEHRKHGAEVGANAYITKGTFEQELLINTLRRLV
ncbi:response regulator [Candidatus Uabimicrobium sp. HlEnr_7]|uniref:hybrid sensor histidine kinase/response regulator n=1 Tax=Candidatus Uabimicrobium helgolandensis TaxID=3095367 RepID=UPI003557789C